MIGSLYTLWNYSCIYRCHFNYSFHPLAHSIIPVIIFIRRSSVDYTQFLSPSPTHARIYFYAIRSPTSNLSIIFHSYLSAFRPLYILIYLDSHLICTPLDVVSWLIFSLIPLYLPRLVVVLTCILCFIYLYTYQATLLTSNRVHACWKMNITTSRLLSCKCGARELLGRGPQKNELSSLVANGEFEQGTSCVFLSSLSRSYTT
ncbi:unnamed protein product [Somion occarium]|uniref:Uncharacterized protein n=1 Tax=Somion occarium TaxID=3059160 RepID=A0ABP1CJ99_9APHY